MKKLIILAALLLPVTAGAQGVAARASIGMDYKIQKGLHLEMQEELRIADGLSGINSLRTTAGLSWKASDYFKFGGSYTLIRKPSGDPRHRVCADATASYRLGDLQFSLKEKLQLTHRTDDSLNVYQSVRNALALKSRVGVKYKGLKDYYGLEPFAYFELRTALNEPWGVVSGDAQKTNSGREYYTYTHTGYTHIYNNRYRANLGVDYSPARHHTFTLNVLLDWCSDYVIDTNGPSKWETDKGVRLFTDTTGWNDYFRGSLCLGYVLSF